jgi:hypothetical protein
MDAEVSRACSMQWQKKKRTQKLVGQTPVNIFIRNGWIILYRLGKI